MSVKSPLALPGSANYSVTTLSLNSDPLHGSPYKYQMYVSTFCRVINMPATFSFNNVFTHLAKIGGGDDRAATELGFGHVTTKTWAHSGVFAFFRIFSS